MFDFIISAAFTVLCIWLFIKAVGILLKLTWGAAKIVSAVLLCLAIPVGIVCLVFLGGVFLLMPVGLILAAIGIVKILT